MFTWGSKDPDLYPTARFPVIDDEFLLSFALPCALILFYISPSVLLPVRVLSFGTTKGASCLLARWTILRSISSCSDS
jgi:hypothetical protein